MKKLFLVLTILTAIPTITIARGCESCESCNNCNDCDRCNWWCDDCNWFGRVLAAPVTLGFSLWGGCCRCPEDGLCRSECCK